MIRQGVVTLPKSLPGALISTRLRARDVAGDLPLDDDRAAENLRVHDGRLSDDQRVLRSDLTFDLTVDPDGFLRT